MFHVIRNYIDSPLQHLNFGCHLVVTLSGGHFNDIQFQREITIFATNFRVIENTLVVYYKNVAVLAIRNGEAKKRVSSSVFQRWPYSLFGYVTLILNTIVARRCVIEVPKLFINLHDIVIKLLSIGSTSEYLLKLTCKFNVCCL